MRSEYKSLYSFGGTPDGASPLAGLTAVNGVLYGTTLQGSVNYCSSNCGGNDCYLGCGTVYKVSASGAEDVIYNFSGGFNSGTDGAWPYTGLLAYKGMLYGTTGGGGAGDHGTVFAVSTSGTESVLYRFAGGTDGGFPAAGLTAANGELYGTTVVGGGSGCGGAGCGTVFEVGTSGGERVVYAFKGGSDGARLYSGLTLLNGKLYGTTLEGGEGCGTTGCGTIFEIGKSGKKRTLYTFAGGTMDGSFPNGLTADNGVLFGTTEGGGTKSSGTFFAVTTAGKESLLYSFQDIPDGNLPGANLLLSKGAFYGTTVGGGTHGLGSVFKVTPQGEESVLYSFAGRTDGSDPEAPVVALKHKIYGTTYQGGSGNCSGSQGGCGTVFDLRL
jgi:uncharacterized repeat protein (TIGR03803 family)